MDNKTAKKAYFLRLRSKALAQGLRNGSFRSMRSGEGINFSGVREYFDGDDVRAIDWNVTARMGRPYVKMFEEDRELNVFLILDTSLSMNTGSASTNRLQQALECASLMTFASYQNASPIGAVIFDGSIRFSCVPKTGADHVMFLLSQYERASEGQKKGSCLDNALQGAYSLLKKRSLVMIFSDFRTDTWSEPFGRLCQKHDVIAVRIADPSDDHLPLIGSIPFFDPETSLQLVLPTSSSKFRRQWSDHAYHHLENWKHECVKRGGRPLVISTSGNPLPELTRFFTMREH